jgi:ketosteroid isomerase-like protein
MIIADEQVLVEAIGRGEQTGPFKLKQAWIEPTHQKFEFHFAQVCRVKNGKIERIHSYSDAFRILTSTVTARRAAA